MNTFGSKINFAETVQHGQPPKLLKTISLQLQICPCSGGVLSEANASTNVPSKGTRSATKDEGKLQRAGPSERRMSGDSSSFLILGPDRFKGECSWKGVELPFLSELTEPTCVACAKCGKRMWWGAELLRNLTVKANRGQDIPLPKEPGRKQLRGVHYLVKQRMGRASWGFEGCCMLLRLKIPAQR